MEALLDSVSCDDINHKIILLLRIMDMLRDLEDELNKLARRWEKVTNHLLELLNDLLIIVKNPKFEMLFRNRKNFDFSFISLESLVEADDDDPHKICMRVLEILACLPKNDLTSQSFQACMLDNVEYFDQKLDLDSPEHKWVLETGFDFRVNLAHLYIPVPKNDYEQLEVEINRENLVQESISKIIDADTNDLANGVSIRFVNEEGIGDGVRRDWLISVVGKMVESHDAFETSGDELALDHTRIYPKKGSSEDAAFYRCFGRLIVLALIHDIQVGITLDNVLFLQLAGKEISLEDIRTTAPYTYNGYREILESSSRTLSTSPVYFSDGDGEIEAKKVTTENRDGYVAEKIQKEFVRSIKAQTDQILEGFDDLLTVYRLEIFRIIKLEDLDFMIRGIEELKVEDWIKFTTYDGYTDTDPQITWFWQCVRDFSEERKKKLLYIWASIKTLPRGGFKALHPPLAIRNWGQDEHHLPSTHTCFGTLDFPPYESYEIMHGKLLLAIDNCDCSFQLE